MKRMPTAREQHFRTKHHRADAPDILEEKKISTDKKELRNKNQSEREILVYDVITSSKVVQSTLSKTDTFGTGTKCLS